MFTEKDSGSVGIKLIIMHKAYFLANFRVVLAIFRTLRFDSDHSSQFVQHDSWLVNDGQLMSSHTPKYAEILEAGNS
jgi:hypothetical protein